MKIKPIETPFPGSEDNSQLTETHHARRTAELLRLLTSRDAVLREMTPWAFGGGQW